MKLKKPIFWLMTDDYTIGLYSTVKYAEKAASAHARGEWNEYGAKVAFVEKSDGYWVDEENHFYLHRVDELNKSLI